MTNLLQANLVLSVQAKEFWKSDNSW